MNSHKKLIMSMSVLALLAIAYTSFWFTNKSNIEKNIDISFTTAAKQFSAEKINYDLNVGCFPFMCLTLKNIEVQTPKNFAMSQEGFLFKALNENTLEYKTYNIFTPVINLKKKTLAIDFTIINLTGNQSIKLTSLADDFNFFAGASNSSLEMRNLSLQITTQNFPLMHLAEVGHIKAYHNNQKESAQAGFSLSNVLIFSPQENSVPKTITHLKADFDIQNFPADEIDLIITKYQEEELMKDPAVITEIFQTLANKQTKLTIKDFKLTDDDLQISAKSDFSIDTDTFLNANINASFKFFTEGNPLEQLMKNSNITQNENKSYEITISATPRGGFLNGNLLFPAINLTPQQPQSQDMNVTPQLLKEKLNLTPEQSEETTPTEK